MKKVCDEHIRVGAFNNLRVDRVTDHGLFLSSNKDDFDVLLPNAYVKPYMEVYSIIEVFVYSDSEDRPVATTEIPKLKLHDFATLEVIDTNNFGAFLDWGLQKDLLLPKTEQTSKIKIGDFVPIFLDIDARQRLYASQKIDRYLEKGIINIKKNQEVKVLVYAKTNLGYKCVVENLYEGLIFFSDVFENINIGDTKKAFVKNIRDDDKIDLTLAPLGAKNSNFFEDKVLETLKQNGGKSKLNSKSDSEDILKEFNISKKAFKKAINSLKEKNKIDIKDTGINAR
jgi:predicted RNA-binding protein (virulence factor B family)